MALEDIESAGKYISDLVDTNPVGSTDNISDGDGHIRGIKNTLLNTFPNITGAMTATHIQLNLLDGVPAGLTTTEIGYLDGVTSAIQTQLDARLFSSNNLSDLDSASTARTNLGLGPLATLSSVSDTYIDADSIGTSELKSTSAEADWIQSLLASYAGVGEIGTYAFCQYSGLVSPGSTVSGASLNYASASVDQDGVAQIYLYGVLSGTWRCMGYSYYTGSTPFWESATLWLRIA